MGAAVANASRPTGGAETVLTSHKGDLGEQLVVEMNGQKLSLYISIRDREKSTCYGRCAKVWLPVIDRGQIVVANRSCHRRACNIDQERIGTVRRKGGALQITYHGHPLYRYREDTKTGQVHGQGKDLEWTAILPDGAFYCKGLAICGVY